MKVLILGDPHEPHMIKWLTALAREGLEIILFSFTPGDPSLYRHVEGIDWYDCGLSRHLIKGRAGSIAKLAYLKALPKLRRIIRRHRPGLLHAHYASGYGLLAALSGFKPYMVSAWGNDVLDFPDISPLHKRMIRFVLQRADRVLSTSRFLASEIEERFGIASQITPFGVDTKVFCPDHHRSAEEPLRIGSIKNMNPEYSLRNLLWTFKKVRTWLPETSLRFMIVGEGRGRSDLEGLARYLGIDGEVDFTGYIPYAGIVQYHNMIDVYVNLTTMESFGVSVLEASACERPVVASDVGGLRETVRNGTTGFLVQPGDIEQAAESVYRLILDHELRKKMGTEGRKLVQEYYSLEKSVNRMMGLYKELSDE
jgi:glycosyltransferase involved in cell wall biosynthesis